MKVFQLTLLMMFSLFGLSAQLSLQIEAGDYNRDQTPIAFQYTGKKNISLRNQENGKLVPVIKDFSGTYWFLLDEPLAARQTRIYKIVKQPKVVGTKPLSAEQVVLKAKDAPVVTYQVKTQYPAKGRPDYYKRSGFFHPLLTPSGIILTDPFPAGHEHQHGVFMTWVNTTFRGRKTDFWNQQQQSGTVRVTDEQVRQTQQGGITILQDELAHVAIDEAKSETVVLKEWQSIKTYPLKDSFLFDIQSEQTNVTTDTLFINKYHYGGMAFRGNACWNPTDSTRFQSEMKILTSEGKTRAESNHTKPNWVIAYGEVEGKMVGIAIFDHPSNFRFPQPVRVHPEMPYFCFSPMVEAEFQIVPQQKYNSQYRFLVFDGAPDLSLVERIWQDYAHPPIIKWLP